MITRLEKMYCAVFGRLHGALNRPEPSIHDALAAVDLLRFSDDVAWSLVDDLVKCDPVECLPPEKQNALKEAWAASDPAYAAHLEIVFLISIADAVVLDAGERIAASVERRRVAKTSPLGLLLSGGGR